MHQTGWTDQTLFKLISQAEATMFDPCCTSNLHCSCCLYLHMQQGWQCALLDSQLDSEYQLDLELALLDSQLDSQYQSDLEVELGRGSGRCRSHRSQPAADLWLLVLVVLLQERDLGNSRQAFAGWTASLPRCASPEIFSLMEMGPQRAYLAMPSFRGKAVSGERPSTVLVHRNREVLAHLR